VIFGCNCLCSYFFVAGKPWSLALIGRGPLACWGAFAAAGCCQPLGTACHLRLIHYLVIALLIGNQAWQWVGFGCSKVFSKALENHDFGASAS
jgi:hypothetical protein